MTADDQKLVDDLAKALLSPDYDCPGDAPEFCGYTCQGCQESAREAADIDHGAECIVTRLASRLYVKREGSPLPLPKGWHITIEADKRQAIVTCQAVGGVVATDSPNNNIASYMLYRLACDLAGSPFDA